MGAFEALNGMLLFWLPTAALIGIMQKARGCALRKCSGWRLGGLAAPRGRNSTSLAETPHPSLWPVFSKSQQTISSKANILLLTVDGAFRFVLGALNEVPTIFRFSEQHRISGHGAKD